MIVWPAVTASGQQVEISASGTTSLWPSRGFIILPTRTIHSYSPTPCRHLLHFLFSDINGQSEVPPLMHRLPPRVLSGTDLLVPLYFPRPSPRHRSSLLIYPTSSSSSSSSFSFLTILQPKVLPSYRLLNIKN